MMLANETNRSVLRCNLDCRTVRLICKSTLESALLGVGWNADSTRRNAYKLDATELDAYATDATELDADATDATLLDADATNSTLLNDGLLSGLEPERETQPDEGAGEGSSDCEYARSSDQTCRAMIGCALSTDFDIAALPTHQQFALCSANEGELIVLFRRQKDNIQAAQ